MANILHATHRYWPVMGGSELYVQQIALRQVRQGHRVTVLTTDADEMAYFWDRRAARVKQGESHDSGVQIIRVPVRHVPGSPIMFGLLRRLQSSMSRFRGLAKVAAHVGQWTPYLPELAPILSDLGNNWHAVISWNVTFDHLMSAVLRLAERCDALLVAVPLLHLGEGKDSPVRRHYTMPHQLDLLRRANRVVAQTSAEQSFLVDRGVDAQRLVVAGAGIDPHLLEGGNSEAFIELHSAGRPIVTFIGPLTRNKGTLHLLKASKRLWLDGSSFILVLAGPMMSDFRRYWGRLSAAFRARVRVLGVVSEQEKRDLLAATDLLVLPSRTEAFGIVLLEAWFYGKPVIGADSPALAEVIEDGVDGRLVPYGDVPRLGESIAEILGDPAYASRLGKAGRLKTLSRYTWDAVFDRFSTGMDLD